MMTEGLLLFSPFLVVVNCKRGFDGREPIVFVGQDILQLCRKSSRLRMLYTPHTFRTVPETCIMLDPETLTTTFLDPKSLTP